jgi:hypothetical protein
MAHPYSLAGYVYFWLQNILHCTTVHGCGLLMEPNDKLSIFFTLNGKLKGQFGDGNQTMV